jgi:hypothetical protein
MIIAVVLVVLCGEYVPTDVVSFPKYKLSIVSGTSHQSSYPSMSGSVGPSELSIGISCVGSCPPRIEVLDLAWVVIFF